MQAKIEINASKNQNIQKCLHVYLRPFKPFRVLYFCDMKKMFLGNIGTIELHPADGAEKAEVTISVDCQQMKELYEVVDGGVKVYGIADMLKHYFYFSGEPSLQHVAKDRGLVQSDGSTVNLSVSVSSSGQTDDGYDADVRYSAFAMPTDEYTNYFKFLSRKHAEMLPESGVSSVSFIGNDGVDFCMVIEYSVHGNVVRTRRNFVLDASDGCLFTYTFGWSDVINALAGVGAVVGYEQIIAVKFSLNDMEGNELDVIQFFPEMRRRRSVRSLVFFGGMGEMEVLNMTGDLADEIGVSAEYVREGSMYRKIFSKTEKTYTLYSMASLDEDKGALEDLANAKQAWIIDGDDIEEVTIVEIDAKDTSMRREPMVYSVKYRFTDDGKTIKFKR